LLALLLREGVEEASRQRGSDLWLAEHAPAAPFDATVSAHLRRTEELVASGCVDDVPVGVLLADRRLLHDERRIARITFVFVHPEAREIGIGAALVALAESWALAVGCAGVDGLALPGDRQTKNLYERAGLTARAIVVHRSFQLPGPTGDATDLD
jgi:GNAT superfamily N-acetyltransferase